MAAKKLNIVGIESSCDDTSVAVLENAKPLANIVAGQTVHNKYGGVVPELASRSHQENIVPTMDAALDTANLSISDIDAIAFTQGPGLLGSLLVGNSFAKGLSIGANIPLIAVNHMEAHILAHFIDGANILNASKPDFPFLCLTISGGHTELVLVKSYNQMKIVGKTIDDAAGEAFDKVAKMLGLPYPGGPEVSKWAENGNRNAFQFALTNVPDLDFSFSGFKTSVLYTLKKQIAKNPDFIKQNMADICASAQYSITIMLTDKLIKAADKLNIKNIAIAGGVSANAYLRKELKQLAFKKIWKIFIPHTQYCTDNAAMIAMAGFFKYKNNDFAAIDVPTMARILR